MVAIWRIPRWSPTSSVPLDPTKVLQGIDTQIEKAVEVLRA